MNGSNTRSNGQHFSNKSVKEYVVTISVCGYNYFKKWKQSSNVVVAGCLILQNCCFCSVEKAYDAVFYQCSLWNCFLKYSDASTAYAVLCVQSGGSNLFSVISSVLTLDVMII